jgi:hypothetical protein
LEKLIHHSLWNTHSCPTKALLIERLVSQSEPLSHPGTEGLFNPLECIISKALYPGKKCRPCRKPNSCGAKQCRRRPENAPRRSTTTTLTHSLCGLESASYTTGPEDGIVFLILILSISNLISVVLVSGFSLSYIGGTLPTRSGATTCGSGLGKGIAPTNAFRRNAFGRGRYLIISLFELTNLSGSLIGSLSL